MERPLAEKIDRLRAEIAALVAEAAKMRGLPDVRVHLLGELVAVEIRVFKEDLGTVSLASSSYAKVLKEKARLATGKEKITYEIVAEVV